MTLKREFQTKVTAAELPLIDCDNFYKFLRIKENSWTSTLPLGVTQSNIPEHDTSLTRYWLLSAKRCMFLFVYRNATILAHPVARYEAKQK